MIKIMLVEDDKSLREIYGVRLLAEGYDIVSAGDGEEALAMAIKERPQLIISDVMMPKVSGYDMLDILRSTTETKNIRVIMMTALSSEEQRTRAESLGADRYLVKSQVGIEDVVRVVHEVLEDTPELVPTSVAPTATVAPVAPVAPVVPVAPVAPATATAPAMQTPPAPQPQPQPAMPSSPTPYPVAPQPAYPATPSPVTTAPPTAPVFTPQAPTPLPQPGTVIQPVTPQPLPPTVTNSIPFTPKPVGEAPKPASLKTRIIQPISDPNISPININDLLDKELAKEAGIPDSDRPVVESVDQEKAQLEEELRSFTPPELTPVEAPPVPTTQTTQYATSVLPVPGVSSSSAPVATETDSMAMPAGLATEEPSQQPTLTPPAASIPTPPAPPAPTVPLTTQPTTAPMPTPITPPTQQTGPLESPSTTVGIGPSPVLPEVPKI